MINEIQAMCIQTAINYNRRNSTMKWFVSFEDAACASP